MTARPRLHIVDPSTSTPRRTHPVLMLLVLAAIVLIQIAAIVAGVGRDLRVGTLALGDAALFGQLFGVFVSLVLLWRIALVARYRAIPSVDDDALPTIAVIVPAFNEGRQVHASLHSLVRSDYPAHKLQIIALDDGSADDTWSWMSLAAREIGDQVLAIRCTRNGGKRRALYEGFRRTNAEIVVTVDSDSEVLPDTLRNLVTPLVLDQRVGAVAGNVRVLNADAGPIAAMIDVTFTYAFEFMRASENEVDAVMCCPGALSAYRRSIVDEFRDAWVDETFMGEPAGIGEDRAMTNEVLRRGHLVRFQANAIVLTEVPTRTRQLSKMLLRWARSNVRESLVMATFAFRRFREGSMFGARANLVLSVLGMLVAAVAFPLSVLAAIAAPATVPWMMAAGVVSGLFPALVFASTRSVARALWAFPYGVYSLLCLTWITPWGLLTPHRSGWLTRGLPTTARVLHLPANTQPLRTADESSIG